MRRSATADHDLMSNSSQNSRSLVPSVISCRLNKPIISPSGGQFALLMLLGGVASAFFRQMPRRRQSAIPSRRMEPAWARGCGVPVQCSTLSLLQGLPWFFFLSLRHHDCGTDERLRQDVLHLDVRRQVSGSLPLSRLGAQIACYTQPATGDSPGPAFPRNSPCVTC